MSRTSYLDVVSFDNYRKDELISACVEMQSALGNALAELHFHFGCDEECMKHHFGCDDDCRKRHEKFKNERLYTRSDVEALCAMVAAGKAVAEILGSTPSGGPE